MPVLALRRRLPAVLAAAILVCADAAGCGRKPAEPAKAAAAAAPPVVNDVEELGWMRLDLGPRPPDSLLAFVPVELPERVRGFYRLKPDRRMLYAFAEVDRLLSGRRTVSTLAIRFEDGLWRLTLDGNPIGVLPEMPSSSDFHELLSAWTAASLERHPITPSADPVPELASLETDLAQGSSDRVLAALQALNSLAAKHPFHPRLLAAAARGTAWLMLQTHDELDLADPLAGHAVALMAMAQSLEPGSLAADEALLDRALGYEAASVKAARSLPADDPVRLWTEFDGKGLLKAAAPRSASPRTQYLNLLELARRGGREAWFDALGRSAWAGDPNVPALHALLLLRDFGSDRSAPAELSRTVLGMVPGLETQPRGKAEAQTRSFETAVDHAAAASDGALLDRESVRAFYRANFYSGFAAAARFLFDELGSTDAAGSYAKAFVDPAPGTAAELREWMTQRAAALRRSLTPAQQLEALEKFRHIGAAPVVAVALPLSRGASSGNDPFRRKAMKIVFRRLDSRPFSLPMGWDGGWEVQDLGLMEACDRGVLDEAPVLGGLPAIRAVYWKRDAERLKSIASDRRGEVSIRITALAYLGDMQDPDTAFRKARYLEMTREQPDDPYPLDKCVQLLRNAKDLAGAQQAIREWLVLRPTKAHDLPWAHVVTLQADLLASEKKWKEAWSVIQPALVTWKGEVLAEAAWILEELRRWDEALTMARAAHDRYPESVEFQEIIARVLWRQHEHAAAAEGLAKSRTLSQWNWENSVSKSFARVFATEDPHQAQNAMQALQERNVNQRSLSAFARAVGDAGNHRLAFALLNGIPATEPEASLNQIAAHDELEKTDGKDAADDWLRKNMRVPHQVASLAYGLQRYDLLWETLDDPARTVKADETQVVRAASLLHAPNPERRDALVAYFEAKPRKGWAPMGLFLVDRAGPEEIFAQATNAVGIANLGWMMGLRAARDGRYADAASWFDVALETCSPNAPPVGWSDRILERWKHGKRYLSDLPRGAPF